MTERLTVELNAYQDKLSKEREKSKRLQDDLIEESKVHQKNLQQIGTQIQQL